MADLQVMTRTNEAVTLQEGIVRKFKEGLRGELILSNEAGYDDARSIWIKDEITSREYFLKDEASS